MGYTVTIQDYYRAIPHNCRFQIPKKIVPQKVINFTESLVDSVGFRGICGTIFDGSWERVIVRCCHSNYIEVEVSKEIYLCFLEDKRENLRQKQALYRHHSHNDVENKLKKFF